MDGRQRLERANAFLGGLPYADQDAAGERDPQLAREPGKLLHGVERIRSAAVQVLPDGASRPDPRRVDPLREDARIGRWGEVVHDVAVHQRVEVGADHHQAPRRGDRADNRGRLRQPGGLGVAVAQREGIARRLGVPEARLKPALPVGLERHAAVADHGGFGDRTVAGLVGEFERQGRRGPLARLNLGDVFPGVDPFVVPAQVVIPGGRPGGEHERGPLVRHPAPAAGHDAAESHPVVKRAHVQHVVGAARRVPQRDPRALAPVDRLRVHAAPAVPLVRVVALDLAHGDPLPQVDAVDDHAQRRGLDHRAPSEGDIEAQPGGGLVAGEQPELDRAVGTRDERVVRVAGPPRFPDVRGERRRDGGRERRGQKGPA